MKGLYDACHDDPHRIAAAVLDRCTKVRCAHTVFIHDDGELQITPTSRARIGEHLSAFVGTFDADSERLEVVEAIRDRVWAILKKRMRRKAA